MTLRKNFTVASLILGLLMAFGSMVKAQEVDPKIKEFETKYPNGIIVTAKVLGIDAQKGDISIRLEFAPDGDLIKEDLTLTKTLKLDTESSNGKTEVTFEKGKRMNATEVLLNMYEGAVEDYPFDKHKADLYIYIITKPEKKKEAAKETAKESASADHNAAEGEQKEAAQEEPEEEEVPVLLIFNPTASGYTITTEKGKDSDDQYVHSILSISRSGMVTAFASFIMILMWAVSLAVLALVFTVVIGGRKSELAMFSFIATLIFAFVTVRNSLPGVPPVGTFSDKLSFFWVEGILGFSLLAVVLTWVFRKPS